MIPEHPRAEPVASSGGSAAARPPLDDVMLAMDVVDTLRRRQRLVERELDEAGRADDLRERLRRIYAQQGIEVPDHVIDQGVAALREDRFTYRPPQAGLARKLALVYITRGRWGKWAGGGLAAVVLTLVVNFVAVVAPRAALPEDLAAAHAQAIELAATDAARARVDALYQDSLAALRADDTDAARAALDELQWLQRALDAEYTIQVVNRPDTPSGIWRVPDANTAARNYYLVVEAVDRRGERVELRIANEETGRVDEVSTWGLRVGEAVFDAVRRDKQDDGIIQNDRVGRKVRGELDHRYEGIDTTGATITRW